MSVLLGSGSQLVPGVHASTASTRVPSNAAAGNASGRAGLLSRRCGELALVAVKLAVVPLSAIAVSASWPDLAQAGILSGYRGWDIELPRISIPDSVKENAENQRKKYEDFDANVKKSPFIQELLKRSKQNAAKRKQEIEDKYCERQAEWGVGDCSLEYSTPEEKEKFLELMKKKRAETEKLGEAAASNEQETTQPAATVPTEENEETETTTMQPSD